MTTKLNYNAKMLTAIKEECSNTKALKELTSAKLSVLLVSRNTVEGDNSFLRWFSSNDFALPPILFSLPVTPHASNPLGQISSWGTTENWFAMELPASLSDKTEGKVIELAFLYRETLIWIMPDLLGCFRASFTISMAFELLFPINEIPLTSINWSFTTSGQFYRK